MLPVILACISARKEGREGEREKGGKEFIFNILNEKPALRGYSKNYHSYWPLG